MLEQENQPDAFSVDEDTLQAVGEGDADLGRKRLDMVSEPFVVFALPRCRTAWLSRFLTYREWCCGHDQARYIRSVDDVRSWLAQGATGTVETAAASFWRTLRTLRPKTRVVVVRRPVEEVVESAIARYPFERTALIAEMRKADHKLRQIAHRWPNVIEVSFAELASEETCKRVFEHCLPYPFDKVWWETLSRANIQINLPAIVRYCTANEKQLTKTALVLRQNTMAEFARRSFTDRDGITYQIEPIDKVYHDAYQAMRTHLAITDQSPEPETKNFYLMRRLEEAGAFQAATARCNGRIVGYLWTVIGPSLEGEEVTSGIHFPFFADPAFPGVGMKLQRFSRDQLVARGVTEILMRAGFRGSGPRLGTMYRRLGAESIGEVFRLAVGDR